jgi:hypothetical protein
MGWVGRVYAPAMLEPRERTPGIRWKGGLVGLSTGLDTEAREKILCPAEDRTPVVQSVDRHYTDWANPGQIVKSTTFKNQKERITWKN